MATTSKMYRGSICLDDLIELQKKGHSAFSKSGSNGKTYVRVIVWVNEKFDEWGNDCGIQMSSKKDLREAEGTIYIGNASSK